ncbi:MAG: prephenate dehydratase domain-containing protein [Pyrinomonadaceae bacterium]
MLKRIAFQGEHGSFAEEAAEEFFAGMREIIACPELSDLRAVLETEAADYAVLPVENSLIGKVQLTDDFLALNPWREVGQLYLPIRLNLIGGQMTKLENLETVESHPAALAQCQKFFLANPQLQKVAAENTAASARRVIESRNPSQAAIASTKAAEIFGGKILLSDIQDKHENYTKFLLLRK